MSSKSSPVDLSTQRTSPAQRSGRGKTIKQLIEPIPIQQSPPIHAELPEVPELAFDDGIWQAKEQKFSLVQLFESLKNDRRMKGPA
jgi:hypothetical protein